MRKKQLLAAFLSACLVMGNISVATAAEETLVLQSTGENQNSSYYDMWWDFEDGNVWTNTAVGSAIIAEGGTSGANLTLKTEGEGTTNSYMSINANKSGSYRVSRLDITNELELIAGTEVSFDWKPMAIQDSGSRFGDVSFLSGDNTYSYFGLQFGKDMAIKYYTVGENIESGWGLSYSEEELEGGLVRNSAYDSGTAGETGVVADGNSWYSVDMTFDYFRHTAALTISQRDTDTILFTKTDIPIYESAADISTVLVGGWKGTMEMGIDNFGVKYLTEIAPELYYSTYWNDFEDGIWENTAISKSINAQSAAATLTHKGEGEAVGDVYDNYYMDIVAGDSNGKFRASQLDLPQDPVAKSEITFDWMPVMANSGRYGDVGLVSTGSTYPYFGLSFGNDMAVKFYTVGENIDSSWAVSNSTEALEGGIVRNGGNAEGDTGIVADGNTWYTVDIVFDYETHTADLAIADRDTEEQLFAKAGIPIYASAVNSSIMYVGGWKTIAAMAMDNLGVKYTYSAGNDIMAITQPENVMVLPENYEAHIAAMPDKTTATMGDGTTMEFALSEWSCEPEFNPETYGLYTWTAEIVVPEGYRNPKNYVLTYTMEYVKNYKVSGAYDPLTLELLYGEVSTVEEFEALRPATTQVVLNNGVLADAELDASSWTAINASVPNGAVDESLIPETAPEFDPAEEGIYVYKVKLAEDGTYPLENGAEIWVEWRVNYYSTGDNFYGNERGTENIDRGLYAINNVTYDAATGEYVVSEDGGVYLSWRVLVDEYALVSEGKDIVFEVYRNDELVTSLTNITNYVDKDGCVGDAYRIKAIQCGVYSYSNDVVALEDNYISLKLQRPLASYGKADNIAIYRLNDTEVADVDGDNEYELIVKWYPTNGFDAGKAQSPSSPHIIDVYEMDGTALWRLYMGHSSPAGQHSDSFIVYDLDNDGMAELSILTHDGTRTYRPDENGKFAYVTTTEGGYEFVPADASKSESGGTYELTADGTGYVLSDTELTYVGELGSPVMDDAYLIDVVGDITKEGVGILDNGHKATDGSINEYFTVFNGATGEVIDTVDYYYNSQRMLELMVETWGESSEDHLSTRDRFNIGIATISADCSDENCTETIPAVICNRAYYSDMSHVAYTLVDGKIKEAWKTYINTTNEGGGNHNFATGDLDNDGFDEIYMGGTTIDHDGTVLWAKDGYENRDFMKHGDSIHMAAVFPDSEQLYVFTPVEDGSVSTIVNYALSNGANGGRVVGHTFGKGDTGRGMLANITPTAGYEIWASNGDGGSANGRYAKALYNVSGEVESESRPAVQTWASYWDGDLLSELPDSNPTNGADKSGLPMGVHKYNWETGKTETIASFAGTWTNNSTKNNPCLIADILGDWREEILVRATDNEELRIYMTSIETDYMIYSLMQDPTYRNSVANQNNTYNQPTHTSFYLGEDEEGRNRVLNYELPVYEYSYTSEGVAKYTDVQFETNGGTEAAAAVGTKLGSKLTAPEGVRKEGYTLEGWYTDAALTAKWSFEEDTVEEAITLYANWVISDLSDEERQREQVNSFIQRMYECVLNRAADEEGLNFWTDSLLSGERDGANVAVEFILSEEFINNDNSNEEYVGILYKAFFGRDAEEEGLTYWCDVLTSGAERRTVAVGFVNSQEYFDVCNSYGINRGVLTADGCAVNAGIYAFAVRLYETILGRDSDKDGVEYWTFAIYNQAVTPQDAAVSFLSSEEYLAKNTSNEDFVRTLYGTFMSREADAAGLAYWMEQLEGGMSRMDIAAGFAGSEEFSGIMKDFGL